MTPAHKSSEVREYYGTIARIGLINMAGSTVMEPEFYAMAPAGVSVHTSRMHLPNAGITGLTAAMSSGELERCTTELAAAPLHVITFGGTSATFLNGRGWDEKVRDRMTAVSRGISTSTTSTACLRALATLEVSRVSFITPYLDEVTEAGRNFFQQCGFDVDVAAGMRIATEWEMGEMTTEDVYRFALKNASRRSDAVLISCTNLRTIGAIAPLEEELKVPVITAVQASFWHCLRVAGVNSEVKGFGRLFQQGP